MEPKGYSSFAIFSHPGNQWLKTADEKRIKSLTQGKFYEMQVIDAAGDEYTVIRQVTEKFNWHTRRMYEHSEFYYLNTNINDDKSSMRLLDGSGKQKGYLTSFATQERTDTKSVEDFDKYVSKGVFVVIFWLTGAFAAEAIGGSLFAINNISTRVGAAKAIVGAGSDYLSQRLFNHDKPTNWVSVASNGIFANPFTGAFGGSAASITVENGKVVTRVSSVADITTGTATGGLGNWIGGKIGIEWMPRRFGTFKDLSVRGSINLASGFVGNGTSAATGPLLSSVINSVVAPASSTTQQNSETTSTNEQK